MYKIAFIICMITIFIPCILFSETHVDGEMGGEVVWDLDGSPYIVDEHIEFAEGGAELTIEPGVVVQFTNYTGIYSMYGGTIIAEGTPEDSILFIPTPMDARWSGIHIDNLNAVGSFNYCYFFRSYGHHEADPVFQHFRTSFELRHSTIRHASFLLHLMTNEPIIEDCLFDGFICQGIIPYHASNDSAVIRRCVFIDTTNIRYCIGTYRGIVDNCIFYGTRFSGGLEQRHGSRVTNSIFINTRYIERAPISGWPVSVSNNCIYDWEGITRNDIEDVGVLNRVNANGDSTDRFGNMILDPQLVGGEDFPDRFFLSDDSPCIDAGNPEDDPDPDGTFPDIGAFFYPQCNINVEPDTVEFIGVQIDEVVELELEIMNIGVLPLQIDSWTIHPVNIPFRINDLEQEFELSPDSSRVVTISFAPLEEQRYEASLLIESNDRDEDILEIPLVGTALGVELSDEALPTEFAITGIYPNPFNSSITITYSLPVVAQTSLVIYDISGRKAAALVDSKTEQGIHKTTFNASDLATGIYFVRMRASDMVQTRKVMFIR